MGGNNVTSWKRWLTLAATMFLILGISLMVLAKPIKGLSHYALFGSGNPLVESIELGPNDGSG